VVITLDRIVLARGSRVLVDGFSGSFGSGDRIGLVGPNGCGKSSLLEAIAGLIPLESGRIEVAPPDAVVGYLRQVRAVPQNWTVLETLRQLTGVAAAEARFTDASSRLAVDDSAAAAAEYESALNAFSTLGVGTLEDRAPAMLDKIGLGVSLDRRCHGLSGGELARLGLVATMLSQFDVLLLDEPTNDLDSDGLVMLRDFVVSRSEPLVMVSHDRQFLDHTITGVIEFDPALSRVTSFDGGYEAWHRERSRNRDAAIDANQRYTDSVAQLQDQAAAARQRSARGVGSANRAYSAGRVDKLTRGAMLEGATASGSSASRIERELDRLEQPEQLRKVWQLQLELPFAGGTSEVLTVDSVVVCRGDCVVGPIDLSVHPGDRLRVVGANGSGKSLLLSVLTGATPPESGRISVVARGQVGVMDQQRSAVPRSDATLIDWFPEATSMVSTQARTLLAKFGLGVDDISRPTSTLSPGERTRANLALLAANETDMLVLDEPTNHLDLPAIEQLEQAINRYAGTLILVTHDETFAASVHIDRTLNLGCASPE
jgi:ATPase subunit of ABC transporter with duplicated ATPase domains